MGTAVTGNEETTEAWSGVLFDRFVEFRDIIVTGLAGFGTEAMRAFPPSRGDRVLDVGCGFGDATQALASLVGDGAEVVGVDVAEPFILAAREEAQQAGAPNVSFRTGDVQVMDLGGPYDYVFSRMGVMFFANPVAALRNIRSVMTQGGLFVAVVWRQKPDNGWMHAAEQVAERYLEEPDETDEPTCGPGPFSMANADTVTGQMTAAGFTDVTLRRCDGEMNLGDPARAVKYAMALGPAGELVRLAGSEVEKIRPQLEREIGEAYEPFVREDGDVYGPASVWIVCATA